MKVMVIMKASAECEAEVMPDPQKFEEMGRFNDPLVAAGIRILRERFSGKKRIVTDRPFAEMKEPPVVRALHDRHGTGCRDTDDHPQIRDQNITKYTHVSTGEGPVGCHSNPSTLLRC
ncbi:MAG: YciI family protein [Steroidobacteraceae bacterium]